MFNKIDFQWKAEHPGKYLLTVHSSDLLCSCDLDLDLDPMTLIYQLDIDILKMYVHTNIFEFTDQRFQKLEHQQDRQTRSETDRHTVRHERTHYQAAFAGGRIISFEHRI